MAVTLERIGRVAKVVFNMPDKMNAMTFELASAFGKVVSSVKSDPDFGAIVVTGSGRAFSAGGDLTWLRARCADSPSRNAEIMYNFYNKFLCVREIGLPVIAAINGPAIGAGLCFAMACDVRVASRDAKLGFTFVGLGLHPGMGATHFVPTIAGHEVAARMLYSGDIVSGSEARELNLVSQVADSGPEAVEAAMSLATRMSLQSPVAVRSTVRSLRQKQNEGLEAALRREADAQSYCYSTEDMLEGIAAVEQKRKPNFVMYETYADSHTSKL
jgi:enoyl-CoA hydratase/carnithine racemase